MSATARRRPCRRFAPLALALALAVVPVAAADADDANVDPADAAATEVVNPFTFVRDIGRLLRRIPLPALIRRGR